MKKIAIIPARGGSKRIPGKNIKLFHGKPIIQYSIDAAIQAKIFNEVMVSTDDEEIADISRSLGAEVPFLRSEKTADDFSGLSDALLEVLKVYSQRNKYFDYTCCILPTAPFLNPGRLVDAFLLLTESKFDSVIAIKQFTYPVQRALIMENNQVKMIWPDNYLKRSQDLPETYHDCGQFYWLRTDSFMNQKKLFMENSGAVVLDELEAQDIDTSSDWNLAEIKHKILYGNQESNSES